jgi:hypothetical protein
MRRSESLGDWTLRPDDIPCSGVTNSSTSIAAVLVVYSLPGVVTGVLWWRKLTGYHMIEA